MSVVLSPQQLAQSRSHSYTMFSRLVLEGVTAELLPYVRAIPELAAALPHPYAPDAAAAQHHDLFKFHLFPYAAIFLDASGLLGGMSPTR